MKNITSVDHRQCHPSSGEMGKHLSQASTGRFLQMEFLLILSPWVGEEAVEVLGSGSQHNPVDWKLPPLTDDGGVTKS